jgi:hypothetical protein
MDQRGEIRQCIPLAVRYQHGSHAATAAEGNDRRLSRQGGDTQDPGKVPDTSGLGVDFREGLTSPDDVFDQPNTSRQSRSVAVQWITKAGTTSDRCVLGHQDRSPCEMLGSNLEQR